MINSKALLPLLVLFVSFSVAAQDRSTGGSQNKQGSNKTAPDDTVNNNYNPPVNINFNSEKRGTKQRQNNNLSVQTSAEGTGEYFLVPAIDRKDPAGTAIRMNTCGAAILLLLDKNALGGLTDDETQPLTRKTVLGVAESRFRMAIKYQPDNYLYHTNLASTLYRQGRIDEALEAINRAIELNPNDEVAKNHQEAILRVKVEVRVLDDEEKNNQ